MRKVKVTPTKAQKKLALAILEGRIDDTEDADIVDAALGVKGGNKYAILWRSAKELWNKQ